MIAYDKSFTPPAPALPAMLTGVVHMRPRVNVQAIIDTAADITAVPADLKTRLKLYRFSQLQSVCPIRPGSMFYRESRCYETTYREDTSIWVIKRIQ
jgi:hypothetical protein